MYNQPTTEVFDLKSENLMLTVSPAKPEDPASPPSAGAPARGALIPD